MPSLNRDLTDGLKLTLSIGVPAGVGLMLLAAPITRLLFQHGAFSLEAGALTSRMIVAYGVGVAAFIGLLIVQRGYYAVGDRITPVRHALAAMGVNVVLDFVLLHPCGAVGLAWATSLAACVQLSLATWSLQPRIGRLPWREIAVTAVQTGAASVAMGVVCWLTTPEPSSGLAARATAVAVPLVAGAVAYFGMAAIVGLREPWLLVRHGSIDRR